ncbi:MMPL family protein [Aeromicrobium marinum DSM 15272]|uniref:MMPL family protein n=1 Tax=Aeromicrobium marinum DSM 15272 TaxID=585531 RepID=E2SBV9_9ACTN|nr:MMPL family transporter [Aeromicrobium marinum]EFQ83245.1 MMPL family protein [Aeromicrobium marinum DSM 15272]
MTTTTERPAPPAAQHRPPGPLGRLGTRMVDHARAVAVVWVLVIAGLGSFAPSVFSDLAGAGWQADDSDSVAARELAEEHFGGNASHALQLVVHTPDGSVDDPAAVEALDAATGILAADARFATIVPPRRGMTVSQDGRTAILLAGAAASPDDMVRAVDDLSDELTALSGDGVEVYPTGASALWSDFNHANHDAMIKAELISWPVTLTIMVIAFGSLVAAGLPLLLTMAGLGASAGALVLLNQVVPISVWAMNFAMMFALALGIDYALFLVHRFRSALHHGSSPRQAVAETMDTAGKAVLLSGLTVLVSLSAVLVVPAPAVRTMAVGIMLAVVFVLAATLTLLPAVLGALGPRVDRAGLPWAKAHQPRSPKFAAWGRLLHRRPWPFAIASVGILVALAIPVFGLKVAMPSIEVVPEDAPVRQGYAVVQESFGDGAPGALQVIAPATDTDEVLAALAGRGDDLAMITPAQPALDDSGLVMVQAIPSVDPSDPAMEDILSGMRADLPSSAVVGGAPAENLDLQKALNTWFPVVVGIILTLGFVLLLIALQAPLIALLGTLVSLLSTAAAFGVARLVFQEGVGADLLGFEPQGFLNGWGPVFFFAMIFAIAMDYTVFLLATAKEHYELSQDPETAQVDGLAHSGRVIFAAAAVMVAVFFTFALAEPLPPKEMGIILGLAVLLDAALVRLILLPVILRLTGHGAWWSPAWLRRVLPSVRFSH